MAEILTSNQNYYDIANTIRQMKKVNTTYKPREMASALKDIYSNEIEGTLPLSFEANGNNLLNYRIDGASGGVGDLITDTSDEKFGKYKIPVVITGKNIFNENSELNTDGTLNLDSGLYPFSVGDNRRTFFFNVKPNTTYTFSCSSIGDRFAVCEYNSIINPSNYSTDNKLSADRNIYSQANGILSYSFTTSSTAKMVGIYYSLNTIPTNIQIEIGNKTTYEPYSEIVTNIYLDNPIVGNESVSLSDTNVSIPTNYGMNIMSINTTIQPSNVYVQVFKDIQGLVDKSLLRKSINKFGSNLSENDSSKSYCDALDDIYDKLPKITQSGAGFTLSDVQNGLLDDFKMNGVDLEQDTTTGKNLLNISDITSGNGIKNNNNKSITLNGNITSTSFTLTNPIILKANATYIMSLTNNDTNAGDSTFILKNGNTNKMSIYFKNLVSNAPFTPTEDIIIDTLRIYNSGVTFNNYTFSIQLEEGSSSTSFEPYTGGIPSPNPDYPQDIKVVEGRQVITDKGKNLFYLNNNYQTNYDSEASIERIDNNSFILTMNKTKTSKQSSCAIIEFNSNYLKSNTTYTISKKNSNTGYSLTHVGGIRLYINGSYGDFADADEYTFTTPSQITSFKILFYLFFDNTITGNYEIEFYDIQLEENSTATDYEPYYNPVSYNIDLNLENIYLAKIPDTNYKNRIYKNNGNWYYERNVEKYIIDGTESWTTQSAYSGYYRYMFVLMENYKNDNLSYGVVGMNSHFIQRITQPHGDYEYLYLQAANNNLLSLYIQIKNLSTIANFKTWLSENNVVVWYVLANPVTTQITNTTLINQLEAISVHTGTNIITISNSNNIIPEIEITRLKELEKLS